MQFEIQKMQEEAQVKRQLMELEFGYNMQLAQATTQRDSLREAEIEDRKDRRTKLQATQQSQMIDQRKNDLLPTDFESQSNDMLSGLEI
jgi:hypothetical protein